MHLVGPAAQETHFSSYVLMPTVLNLTYSVIARQYPAERKRLLAEILLMSMALHGLWELGPLPTGYERIIPQDPRSGTDWGDILAGIGSSTLLFPFIQVVESIGVKYASKSRANRQNSNL